MRTMEWYPVRCCCQPSKIFGFLRLPAGDKTTLVRGPGGTRHLVELRVFQEVHETTDEMVAALQADLSFVADLDSSKELAVYSDDRPIEFWRGIPGFVEVVK